jgi:hypothetical protein
MREIFTSGSGGGAPGNRCFYLDRAEINPVPRDSHIGMKLANVTQWVSDRKTHKFHLPNA